MTWRLDKLRFLMKTGFLHIFGSNVINNIISFLSNVILVRILTVSEYGNFTYAWNIYSIILIANGLGIQYGVLQLCSEYCNDTMLAKKICSYGVKFGVCVDIFLAVLIIFIGAVIPLSIPEASGLLCMLCLLPLVQLIFGIINSFLRSQKRNQEFSNLTVLNTVMILVFTSTGALCLREKGMILGYYAAYLITDLVGIFYIRTSLISKDEKLEQRDRKALISLSVVSMSNNGLSQLLYLLDLFVLGIVAADKSVLANYKVATTIPAALTFIPSALILYIYPYFAEHNGDGRWCMKRYKQILDAFGLFNLLVSSAMFLLAPFILRIVYGAEYMSAVLIFRILSVNYFFSGTFRILSGNLLVTQRKLKFNLLVAVVSGCVNVIADWFFIQWWGAIGAAIATVLVVMVSGAMSTCYLVYTFKKNYREENCAQCD